MVKHEARLKGVREELFAYRNYFFEGRMFWKLKGKMKFDVKGRTTAKSLELKGPCV